MPGIASQPDGTVPSTVGVLPRHALPNDSASEAGSAPSGAPTPASQAGGGCAWLHAVPGTLGADGGGQHHVLRGELGSPRSRPDVGSAARAGSAPSGAPSSAPGADEGARMRQLVPPGTLDASGGWQPRQANRGGFGPPRSLSLDRGTRDDATALSGAPTSVPESTVVRHLVPYGTLDASGGWQPPVLPASPAISPLTLQREIADTSLVTEAGFSQPAGTLRPLAMGSAPQPGDVGRKEGRRTTVQPPSHA